MSNIVQVGCKTFGTCRYCQSWNPFILMLLLPPQSWSNIQVGPLPQLRVGPQSLLPPHRHYIQITLLCAQQASHHLVTHPAPAFSLPIRLIKCPHLTPPSPLVQPQPLQHKPRLPPPISPRRR